MSSSMTALAGFSAWTLLLIFMVVGFRVYTALLSGQGKALNDFSPDGTDVPGFGLRLTRAHLNCVETLPIFAGIIFVASMSDQAAAITDTTAMLVLFARMGQSIVHLISTSVPFVLARATFLSIQLGLMAWYAIQLLF